MTNTVIIPEKLRRDQHWRGLIYIFSNCESLKPHFNTRYFKVHNAQVNISGLKKLSAPWSEAEKFMLKLALQLYNSSCKVNLDDLCYLDNNNFEIAMEAIRLRYRR